MPLKINMHLSAGPVFAQKSVMKYAIAFLLCLFSWQLFAQADHRIDVTVSNIESTKGQLIISLFDTETNFLEKPYKTMTVPATKGSVSASFEGIPAGTYAIAVIHDKNENAELDTNFMGIPKERYGWSNNPSPSFRAARWDEALFSVKAGSSSQFTIKLL